MAAWIVRKTVDVVAIAVTVAVGNIWTTIAVLEAIDGFRFNRASVVFVGDAIYRKR